MEEKIKILKMPAYYDPEQISSSHLSKDLNAAYIAAGFTIENYVPTPTRGIDKATRKKYKKIKYEEKEDGKIIVHRFPLMREGKNPVLRAFRYLLCNLKHYNRGKKAKDIDVIMAGSTPPTQGVLCAKVKKKLSKRYGRPVPFIYNLQDIFPDSLVTAKMTKKGSLIWKLGRKIEDYTYKSADRIIVISEDFKRNIMEKGVPEEKIVVIPNWVNTENVYPVAREDNILFDRLSLDREKFYIVYSGNLGHSQNLRMLLDAAKELREPLPDLCFVLIGEGAARDEIAAAIENEKSDNVLLFPFQPYEDIAHVFSLGDAGLIISKSGIGQSSVPSKTFGIMAAERPVLASFDLDSELVRLIEGTGCGVCAAADDKEAFKAAIESLYENRESLSEKGARGRAYLCDELDKDKCTALYVETVKGTVAESRMEKIT